LGKGKKKGGGLVGKVEFFFASQENDEKKGGKRNFYSISYRGEGGGSATKERFLWDEGGRKNI